MSKVTMGRGSVIVETPSGYCIDGKSLDISRQGDFALVASCKLLGHEKGDSLADAAIMTVVVSGKQQREPLPDTEGMEIAFERFGVASNSESGGVRYLKLKTGGEKINKSYDPQHWRAIFVVNRRAVIVSAYSAKGGIHTSDAGLALLKRFVTKIQNANPVPDINENKPLGGLFSVKKSG